MKYMNSAQIYKTVKIIISASKRACMKKSTPDPRVRFLYPTFFYPSLVRPSNTWHGRLLTLTHTHKHTRSLCLQGITEIKKTDLIFFNLHGYAIFFNYLIFFFLVYKFQPVFAGAEVWSHDRGLKLDHKQYAVTHTPGRHSLILILKFFF